MNLQAWTFVMVGSTFALYLAVAYWSRARSTGDFYIAGGQVPAVVNGMATAADWMSAASFISMAGLISFMGRDGSVYLMGWTGGYVLLALLLAPYLRKFGKYTVPDFVGDRYYSQTARYVAVVCAIFISFTYVAGQMRGVGIVFSHFLNVRIEYGVLIGMGIVFSYAVLGGMKGITYTQVVQYCVLIFAYLVPAIFISILITGKVIPQVGFGSALADGSGVYLLERLDQLGRELGFADYTAGRVDGRHRRTAACDRAFLYRAESRCRTKLRRLGPAVHCDPLYHRSGRGRLRPDQSAADSGRHPLRGSPDLVHQLGRNRSREVGRPQRRWCGPVPRTTERYRE